MIDPAPNPAIVANYVGSTNGSGGAGDANARIGIDKFYSSSSSPVVILSYSEAKFIEAEAKFILAGGSATSTGSNAAAYASYKAGISANMDKLQVAVSDKANYLADTSIDLGITNLKLKDIKIGRASCRERVLMPV